LLDLNNNDEELRYFVETINWFKDYLREFDKKMRFLKFEINSELDTTDNIKFGFGSSAAITIALLRVLFDYHDISYNELTLYKAGVLINNAISKSTSFGDLACIAYEKPIYYKKFNSLFLSQINSLSINELLVIDWPGLIIEEISFNNKFLIVHSKQSANSHKLVSSVFRHQNEKEFNLFLNVSEGLVKELVNNPANSKNIISKLDDNFRYLEKVTNIKLFTKEMDDIRNIIYEFQGTMKFSGAGGGDCVIVFFDSEIVLFSAKEKLSKFGYDVNIYEKGQ
jgi:phosphomevalonate kinase